MHYGINQSSIHSTTGNLLHARPWARKGTEMKQTQDSNIHALHSEAGDSEDIAEKEEFPWEPKEVRGGGG